LLDSAEIQEDDVKYENKRRAANGSHTYDQLYTHEDAEKAFDHFVSVNTEAGSM
jgi:metallo-beta-lactamase family protein